MAAIYHEKTRLLCMINGTRTLLDDSPHPPKKHAPESVKTDVITLPSLRSPIAQHRVPFEILITIFADLLPAPYHHDPSRQRSKSPDWLVVTHVCRYWRAVAYGWTSFWAYLPLESPGWTRTALDASRTAPVYIDAGLNTYGSVVHPHALEIALSGLRRARQVTVASKDAVGIMRTFEGLRASEAPLLEKLELIWTGHDLEPHRRMPKDVFRGKVPPNLRVLNLVNIVVEPLSPVFSASLTHLEIVLLTPLWHNLSQVFDTLATLPNLQHLALNRGAVLPVWFTGPDPLTTDNMRKIPLPALKLLRLNGDSCVVLCILQCIQAPHCETSCIVFAAEREFAGEGFEHPSRWQELPTIVSAVSSLYLPKPNLPCTTLNRLVLTTGMDTLFHTVSEMTEFLRHFPNLETLILRFSPWSALPTHPYEDVAPVYMPRIARLHLWGRYLHVVATASEYISIPPTAERLVTIDGGPPPELPPVAIISTFKSVFQPPADGARDLELDAAVVVSEVGLEYILDI
ncbi:hypothetical protein OF83DRAFT_785145 [Amylostereum chailletii]|nr:hypothetical protein OF83DRAFT_785145 [Amylostereum chailletii]